MISRLKLEKAVRMGLLAASGQPIDMAVQSVIDCLDLVIDIAGSISTVSPTATQGIHLPPPAPYSSTLVDDSFKEYRPIGEQAQAIQKAPPAAPLDSIAPISGTESKGKNRVYWSVDEIMEVINQSSPEIMEVVPEGRSEALLLIRTATMIGTDGVQLAYIPKGSDNSVPSPRVSFWSTDEDLAVAAAVEKIRKQAVQMYRLRTTPIRQPIPVERATVPVKAGEV